jgi:RimJ/RimL family protein N-acetyltransferase
MEKNAPVNLQPDLLEDELVKLVPLQATDFDRLFKVASDPSIWEQHPGRDRYKKEVFQIYFDSAVASVSAFLIFDQKTNNLIGSSRFYDYDAGGSSIAVGYTFLAKEYWGGKYNRSVKKLMLDYAFQFVDTVIFHIGPSNIRSQKAILKIGANKIGEMLYEGNLHFVYQVKSSDLLRENHNY